MFERGFLRRVLPGMLVVLFFLSSSAVSAQEGEAIRAAVREYSGAQVVHIDVVNRSGNYALVLFRQPEGGETWYMSALVQRRGNTWMGENLTGSGPTTDFLREARVPQSHWNTLLGSDRIRRNQGVLDFLRRKNPKAYYVNIQRADSWALVTWSEEDAGGQALLRNVNGSWRTVINTGGVLDTPDLVRAGVPRNLTDQLRGRRKR